jgi:hypothetical protein
MDITRLKEEETSVILDGIWALKLFFDPRCRRVGGGNGDDNGKEKNMGKGGGSGGGEFNDKSVDAEEDNAGDNCYYYC